MDSDRKSGTSNGSRQRKVHNWTVVAIVVLWAVGGLIPALFDDRGTIGDMFGAVNALFSGLELRLPHISNPVVEQKLQLVL